MATIWKEERMEGRKKREGIKERRTEEKNEGRKEKGRKEGRMEGSKNGRKEGSKDEQKIKMSQSAIVDTISHLGWQMTIFASGQTSWINWGIWVAAKKMTRKKLQEEEEMDKE